MCADEQCWAVSVQKEHSAHLHILHWVSASFGLHSAPQVRWAVSPSRPEVQAILGGGGGRASLPKPSQNEQSLQLQSWQFASKCAAEHKPCTHVLNGASPIMPELHGPLVVGAQSAQARHRHRSHEALPEHDGSHSSHFVSCASPELHARNPLHHSHPLHLQVSQCVALAVALQ